MAREEHEVRMVRRQVIVVFAVFLTSIPLFAQSSSPERRDQNTIIASAQDAAVRAVNFRQGDAEGCKRGRRTAAVSLSPHKSLAPGESHRINIG